MPPVRLAPASIGRRYGRSGRRYMTGRGGWIGPGPPLIALARGFDEPRGYLRAALLAAMSILHALSHWVLAPRLSALRAAMGRPIDEVAKTDPLRVAFGQWHGLSSAIMLAVIAMGLVAFAIAPRSDGTR